MFNILACTERLGVKNSINFRNLLLCICFAVLALTTRYAEAAGHTYDSLNRLTSIVYSPTQRIDYIYDAAGNLIEERINNAAAVTVTAQSNPSASGNVSVSPTKPRYVTGETVTLTAAPASGYGFSSWSGVAGCTTNPTCTLTIGTANVAAIANFVSNPAACNLINGLGSVPAAGGIQNYVATCTNIVAHVWALNGTTIAGCTGANCNVSFPANTGTAAINYVVTVYPSTNATSIYNLPVTQAAPPPQCTGSATGQASVPVAGGAYTYTATCTGATSYAWTLNGNALGCTTPTCSVTYPANTTTNPVVYAVGFTASNAFGSAPATPPINVTVAGLPINCSLDFNGDGFINQSDALLFNRWLLGFRGDSLVTGIAPFPANATAAAFATAVTGRMAISSVHDFDGNTKVDAATDGLLFLRLTQGLFGTAVTNGALGTSAQRTTHDAIRTYINTTCGTAFPASVAVPTPSLSINTDQASLNALGAVYPAPTTYSFVAGNGAGRTALKFNGVGNVGTVRIPNRAAMQFTTGATIDLWARVDGDSGVNGNGLTTSTGWAMTVFAKSQDAGSVAINVYDNDANYPGAGYGFGTWASGVAGWGTGTCTVYNRNPGGGIGSWFRLTAVASTTGGTKVYSNKQLIYACPSAVPNFSGMNSQDLYLGVYLGNSWYPLNGAVQDIRIYQRALTDAEILVLP